MTRALTGNAIRRIVLERSFAARTGHIGSSLSVADLVATLYRAVLLPRAPDDP
jgi:transketolase N-terminal domain/subunit